MGERRTSSVGALALAVTAHALVLVALRAPSPSPPLPSPSVALAAAASDSALDVEVEPGTIPPPPATARVTQPSEAPSGVRRLSEGVRSAAAPAAGPTPAAAGAITDTGPAVLEAAPGASAWSLTTTRPPSLDLPPSIRYGAPTPPAGERPVENRATALLRDGLAERDRDRGLGRSGPLETAAAAAVRTSRVPLVSEAVLAATTDAAGNVVSVTATSATSGLEAWSEVASELLRSLRGKKVRVPEGAAGLRIGLRVESHVRDVAGHREATAARPSPVLVTPQDPHFDRAPSVALGTAPPTGHGEACLDTCLASGNIDPTDALLGATRAKQRSVAVRVVSEERL